MEYIKWQILDIYDEDNLIDGILKSLPAYLKLIFNIKTYYSIKMHSPEGIVSGKIEGVSYQGSKEIWRIPVFEQSGEWKLGIYLHDESHTKYILPIKILPNLFENLSELEADIESTRKEITLLWDDWLESFSIDSNETSLPVDADQISIKSKSLKSQNTTNILDNWMTSFDEGIQDIKDTNEVELEKNWVQINTDLKIWQYIQRDFEDRVSKEYTIPILLIHGFNSNYTTWTYMAHYLWEGGFHRIFGMTLYGDFYGLDKNCQHLDKVIREVLKSSQKDYIYLIGHSFGGLVSRQFVKEYDNKNVKLLVTIGSPHYGIAKIFARLIGSIKKRQLEKDAMYSKELPFPTFEAYLNNLEEKLNSIQFIFNDSDLYLLTMINICGDKIYGGDGLFKAIEVPDMINYTINASHLSINKSKATYNLFHSIMTGDSTIYKITLIQVNPTIKSLPDLKFCFYVKPRTNPHYQRYPFDGFLEIEKNKFITQLPLIIFAYCKKEAQNELLDIQVFNNRNTKIAQKELFIGLGYKKAVGDLFDIQSIEGHYFQFAVYSYKLFYKNETKTT